MSKLEPMHAVAIEHMREFQPLALRKATAEAETAELLREEARLKVETQALLRDYLRKAQLAIDLPGFKAEKVS